MISETFPHRLKQIRLDHGLKLKDVALALGIALRSYQRYEAGERQPDIDGLSDLADFYNCSIDYLIGRTDKP